MFTMHLNSSLGCCYYNCPENNQWRPSEVKPQLHSDWLISNSNILVPCGTNQLGTAARQNRLKKLPKQGKEAVVLKLDYKVWNRGEFSSRHKTMKVFLGILLLIFVAVAASERPRRLSKGKFVKVSRPLLFRPERRICWCEPLDLE